MKIKTAPDWEIDTTVLGTNLLNPPYIYPIRQKSNTCVINGGASDYVVRRAERRCRTG